MGASSKPAAPTANIQVSPNIHGARLLATLVAIFASRLYPNEFENHASIPIILTSMTCLVIPHGALDHIAFYQMYHERYPFSKLTQKDFPLLSYWIPKLIFYTHYFAIMILWGCLWTSSLSITFSIFFLLSAFHFGEGDLDYIQTKGSYWKHLPRMVSRGLVVLGLGLLSQPNSTVRIALKFIQFPQSLSFDRILQGVILQHVILLLTYGIMYQLAPLGDLEENPEEEKTTFPVYQRSPNCFTLWVVEIAKTLFFCSLFYSMNPLIALTIYLGVWHSTGHMLSEIAFLKSKRNPEFHASNQVEWRDVGRFLFLCAPFTLISAGSMGGALWFTANNAGSSNVSTTFDDVQAWALFIISISILTGPHLWIVAGLHSKKIDLDPLQIKENLLSWNNNTSSKSE